MLNDVPPRHLGLIAYGAALVVALLWALVFPGWLSLRDMQVIGGQRVVDDLSRGAESYLDTFRAAERAGA